MSYDYETEKVALLRDAAGIRQLLAVRDKVRAHIARSGCVDVTRVFDNMTGDSFQMWASLDLLEEIGELTKAQIMVDGRQREILFVTKDVLL